MENDFVRDTVDNSGADICGITNVNRFKNCLLIIRNPSYFKQIKESNRYNFTHYIR
jgi:hypothetical protein